MMQQALRPYAVAGIAVLGTASLTAFTPAARSLPDVHVPAVQLTSDSSLLGDFSSLFGDVTGGTSGIGGLGDLAGDLTGLLGGLNPSSLLSDLPGLASVDPAPATSSLLTPYIDLFTKSFENLQAIGTEFANVTLPELELALQGLIADPSAIAELPLAVFNALTDPGSISVTLPADLVPIVIAITLGAPVLIGLGEVGPLATTSGALEAFYADLLSGNPTTVLTALIDGPANIANAFLNGSVGLDVAGEPLNLLNGILVPEQPFSLTVGTDLITQLLTYLGADSGLLGDLTSLLGGLPTGDLATITVGPLAGIVDALVNYVPQDILGADPGGTSLLSALDPSTLLSGLNLGDLGGLLDPSTLLGDVTGLLPGLASDLPAGLADLATAIPF
jgi:hypothetical protein